MENNINNIKGHKKYFFKEVMMINFVHEKFAF